MLIGFLSVATIIVAIPIIVIHAVEFISEREGITYRERKARKYEKKADRLRSFLVFMSAMPFSFTNAPHHNLSHYVERYNELAEEWRTGKHG